MDPYGDSLRPLARNAACIPCKARKVRCGAEKPICENCKIRSRTCSYPSTTTTTSAAAARLPPVQRSTPGPTRRHGHRPSVAHSPYAAAYTPTSASRHASTPAVISAHTPAVPSSTPTSMHPSYLSTSPSGAITQSHQSQHTPAQVTPTTQSSAIFESYTTGDHSALVGPYTAAVMGTFVPTAGAFEDGSMEQTMPSLEGIDLSWLFLPELMGAPPEPRLDGLSVQEHCFRLYFAHQRVSGLEMNISRFYARLADPDPDQRPHASLRDAMCLVVCRRSPITSVRAQEKVFRERTEAAIADALKFQRKMPLILLDLLRAATLLANWHYSGATREGSATAMTAIAVRMAYACNLDKITSNKALKEQIPHVRRRRGPVVKPAEDLIDMADRIYAFWSVFILDTAASIATSVPGTLDVGRICTPLPRPWYEYETGELAEDEYLADIFDPQKPNTSATDIGHVIRAITLLHYASEYQLYGKDPLPGAICTPGLFRLLSISTVREEASPAFGPPASVASDRSTPSEDLEVRKLYDAIKRFNSGLPKDHRGLARDGNGKKVVQSRTSNLQFMTGVAEMFLYDTNDYSRPNDRAVGVARGLVGVMRLLDDEEVNDLGVFIYVLWTIIGRVLVREAKKLSRAGDEIGAAVIDNEVDFIHDMLYRHGSICAIAQSEAGYLQVLRQGPPSDAGDSEESDEANDAAVEVGP